ncbi:DapH/DapD/GlmU-related protein [Mycoplasmatota bacterium WC44]
MRILKKISKYIFLKRNIKVGHNCRVLTSLRNFGSEPYLVEIGNNCIITPGVNFVTHDASVDIALRYNNKSRTVGNKKFEVMSKIQINDNCFIGLNSIILPGVSIGPNSVVGAGSIVNKDVPEGVVVAGNPAKIICTIDEYVNKVESRMILINNDKNMKIRKKNILYKLK